MIYGRYAGNIAKLEGEVMAIARNALRYQIKNLLSADPTLMMITDGHIFDREQLGPGGLSITNLQKLVEQVFDANSGELKPLIYIRQTAGVPDMDQGLMGWRTRFVIQYHVGQFSFQGYGDIVEMQSAVHKILHYREIRDVEFVLGGTSFIKQVAESGEYDDPRLNNVFSMFDQYDAFYFREGYERGKM